MGVTRPSRRRGLALGSDERKGAAAAGAQIGESRPVQKPKQAGSEPKVPPPTRTAEDWAAGQAESGTQSSPRGMGGGQRKCLVEEQSRSPCLLQAL